MPHSLDPVLRRWRSPPGAIDLAAGVRRNVVASVERMTGLQVTEVNIEVADVFIPSEDEDDEPAKAPRVQ